MCQAFYRILRSIKTRFTQGRLFYTQRPFFCALGPLFCALVREEAIFAVCKWCANEGFACMWKEKKISESYNNVRSHTAVAIRPIQRIAIKTLNDLMQFINEGSPKRFDITRDIQKLNKIAIYYYQWYLVCSNVSEYVSRIMFLILVFHSEKRKFPKFCQDIAKNLVILLFFMYRFFL